MTPLLAAATRRSFSTLLLLALLTVCASAQTTSTTDSMTPSGLAQGSPAGSYALSGFDNVNLFNGNLNFRLPLLGIGGRGGAAYQMMLAMNHKSWRVKHLHKVMPDGNEINSYSPTQSGWSAYSGYRAGSLTGRSIGIRTSSNFGCTWYSKTLARLSFTAADGTEYELRDQLTGGQPLDSTCAQGAYRGTVFITADGSSATFISDTPVYDRQAIGSSGSYAFSVSGYLMMRDGTRFRIDSGSVTWMRDHNGNKLSFAYDAYGRAMTITDSLNRQVTVNYDVSDVAPYGLCDQIIFRGFGGAQRIIRVSKTKLGNTLTLKQLFPELNGASSTTIPNPTIVSAVWLPNGRSYRFYYNSYGELSRVELPTGGAVEYDVTAGSGVVPACQYCDEPQIYRRVQERRVYADGSMGATFESKTVYDASNSSSPFDPRPWSSTVTVEHTSQSGTVLGRERHYFHGSALASLFHVGYHYSAWNEGRENKTEALSTAGALSTAAVLRRVVNTWEQRAAVSWWSAWATAEHLDPASEPANDPRLTQTVATLVDTNQVSKQTFKYDQYNNRTDVYEYDYGDGAVGLFRRRTHTDYLTTNPVNGADYASLSPDATDGSVASPTQSSSPVPCDTCDPVPTPTPTPTPTPGPTPTPTPTPNPTPNPTPTPPPPDPGVDATIHIRNLPTRQWVSEDEAGTQKKALTTYEYDNYTPDTGNKHAALLARNLITGLDSAFTSSKQTRGNVTAITRRLIQGSRDITTYQQYDVAGNLVKGIDAHGTVTTFTYTDNFGSPNNNAHDDAQPAYWLGSENTFAFVTQVKNALNQIAYTQYDYYLGKGVDAEDTNGTVYSGYYNDPLNRPTQMVRAANDASNTIKNQTHFIYDDANNIVRTTSDRSNFDDDLLKGEAVYDGLGRAVETRSYESSTNYIRVERAYDALGRTSQVSNPYRPHLSETAVWTTTTYDALGRVTAVTTPDNAKVTTTYSGNKVTVKDQAGKDRESTTDALGRLTQVIEDPGTGGLNYQTTYSYDALDDLLTVAQGVQTRTFTYDSLRRLTQATNPESSTVQYQYDDNGNLKKKTDARNIETNYAYDALNRVKSKTYTDGTSPVYYYYDAQILPAGAPASTMIERGASTGRVVAILYGGATASAGVYYGYDGLGRVTQKVQQTGGVDYELDATYNRAGAILTETYPSVPNATDRRIVSYSYDGAGRLASLLSRRPSYGTGASLSDIEYAAHGAVSSESYASLVRSIEYNTRLQPTGIKLGTSDAPGSKLDLSYSYGTTTNNGNVVSATIKVDAMTWSQTFSYDPLNRLAQATETRGGLWQWAQNFDYDRYGNRCLQINASTPCAPEIKPAQNNRLNAYSYDVAGNQLTDDAEPYPHTYTYNAENLVKTVDGDSAYVYNGEGQRVRKLVGEKLRMVYGISGELIVEYDDVSGGLKKEYIYGVSGLLATIEPVTGTRYVTADRLGTPRIITSNVGEVVSRHDYQPFGEELFAGMGSRTTLQGYSSPNDTLRQKFTGYERDNETGLDYAQTRYYGSTIGRFTSIDPLISSAKAALPQSWNRYTYCLNNPLKYVDPTGLIWGYADRDDGMREFKWFDGNEVGKGYTAYTDPTYTFGDGRTAYLDPESSNWQWITDSVEVHANLSDTVEVIIWDSTFPNVNHIAGWGGHVSYNINGESWSWERNGWAGGDERPSIEQYLADQTYRAGTGIVFDGGAEWNSRLAEGIMGGYENVDNGIVLPGFGGYNLVQNNCGEAFSRAINNMGGLPRNTGISPASHREYIENNLKPFIKQINHYPQAQAVPPNIQIGPMVGGP